MLPWEAAAAVLPGLSQEKRKISLMSLPRLPCVKFRYHAVQQPASRGRVLISHPGSHPVKKASSLITCHGPGGTCFYNPGKLNNFPDEPSRSAALTIFHDRCAIDAYSSL